MKSHTAMPMVQAVITINLGLSLSKIKKLPCQIGLYALDGIDEDKDFGGL
ncbi:hypothetical protein [Moraxella sp. Pampa]|nr:hypothetical protein [Moraxella sp. Pampa]